MVVLTPAVGRGKGAKLARLLGFPGHHSISRSPMTISLRLGWSNTIFNAGIEYGTMRPL